jgi:hypothetical protein
MPQIEVSAEEQALLEQSRAAKTKVAIQAAYDTAALEETELEAAPPAIRVVGGGGTAPVPTPPKHHPFIVEKARQLGLADHLIESMSDEELTASIRGAEQYAARERQLASQRQDTAAQERFRPAPREEPQPKPEEADREILADLGMDNPEKFDPDYIKTLVRQEKIRRRDMDELKGIIKQTQQATQQTQAQTAEKIADGYFATLGRDKAFGAGPSSSMVNTPQFARRVAVLQLMLQLGGQNEKNFRQAVDILYPKGAAPAAPTETPTAGAAQPVAPRSPRQAKPSAVPTEEDFEAGVVARPTNRRGAAEVKNEKRAEAKLREAMREQGINPDDDDLGGADEGFLPGG